MLPFFLCKNDVPFLSIYVESGLTFALPADIVMIKCGFLVGRRLFMSTTVVGPRLSDRTFFLEKLDANFPGVLPIREAAEKGDFPQARALFGKLLRETLNPEAFFQH